MSTARLVSIAVVIAASAAMPTLAAQAAPLNRGARIRLVLKTNPPRTLVGTLDTLRPDTLELRMPRRIGSPQVEVLPIPLGTVSTFEVARGARGHAGIGALVGAGLFGLIGLASGNVPPNQVFGMTASEKALFGVLGGAPIGALVGVLVRSENWQTVPLSSLRIAPAGLNGVGITASFSF